MADAAPAIAASPPAISAAPAIAVPSPALSAAAAAAPSQSSLLDTLGEEIVRIVTPVSACMALVVLLVTALASPSSSPSPPTLSTIPFPGDDDPSSSFWDKLYSTLLSSLLFVAAVTLATFLLVFLFYVRCTRFLHLYMSFSALLVLAFLGGDVALLLLDRFSLPLDAPTFLLLLFNFSVLGVVAVFSPKSPILVTQSYLVAIGVLTAYWFTLLPEWTTWALLIAMSLYDLAAVLLPCGPLRLLVEMAISRDEDIPALVYEARPVVQRHVPETRIWRGSPQEPVPETRLVIEGPAEPLLGQRIGRLGEEVDETRLVIEGPRELGRRTGRREEEEEGEGIGLGSSGAIKLGLGDFIFYSVLVGRAAMYSFMAVYACYLAIIAGLGITLLLLAVHRKALPALPVSVMLGVLFYVLTRFVLEEFVVQLSANLLMF